MSLVDKVKEAIEKAENHQSNMDISAFGVSGLTGAKVRHLLNNLCEGETNYLEIGSYKGATLVSALSGNPNAKATAVEGFFEDDDGRSARRYLEKNINKYLGQEAPITLIIGDSFSDDVHIPVVENGPYDVFLYDGNHGENETTTAIIQYAKAMKEEFVLVIDDWTYPQFDKGIRAGTFRALASNNLEVIQAWEKWNDRGGQDDPYSGWWYGLFIAVVKKHG